MRIYVAGPYTAPTPDEMEANVRRACEAGSALVSMGHTPFVPHLNHYLDAVQLQPYETWMAQDLEWLRFCEGLLLVARSPGADREVNWAHLLGLPVWTSLDQVPRPWPASPRAFEKVASNESGGAV